MKQTTTAVLFMCLCSSALAQVPGTTCVPTMPNDPMCPQPGGPLWVPQPAPQPTEQQCLDRLMKIHGYAAKTKDCKGVFTLIRAIGQPPLNCSYHDMISYLNAELAQAQGRAGQSCPDTGAHMPWDKCGAQTAQDARAYSEAQRVNELERFVQYCQGG